MLTSTPILGERERGSTTCKRSLQGEPLLFRPTHFQPPHPRPSYFVELVSCVLPLQGGSLQEPSARHCRWPAVLRKVAWNKQPPPFPQTHRQSLCPRPSCIVQLPSCALESGNVVARPGRLQKYSAQHCSWPALLHKVARNKQLSFFLPTHMRFATIVLEASPQEASAPGELLLRSSWRHQAAPCPQPRRPMHPPCHPKTPHQEYSGSALCDPYAGPCHPAEDNASGAFQWNAPRPPLRRATSSNTAKLLYPCLNLQVTRSMLMPEIQKWSTSCQPCLPCKQTDYNMNRRHVTEQAPHLPAL